LGSHVPRLGEFGLQPDCGGFDTHWLHKKDPRLFSDLF